MTVNSASAFFEKPGHHAQGLSSVLPKPLRLAGFDAGRYTQESKNASKNPSFSDCPVYTILDNRLFNVIGAAVPGLPSLRCILLLRVLRITAAAFTCRYVLSFRTIVMCIALYTSLIL